MEGLVIHMKADMVSVEQVRQLPALHTETIPSDYIDGLGHMNMNRYYDVLSGASRKMLHNIGHSAETRDSLRIGNFVLMHVMKYLKEVLEDEQVTVHGRIIGRTEKKMHVMYFMINDTRENIAATQESLNIHADLKLRRSAPFIEPIAEGIDAVLAEQGRLEWEAPVSGAITL